MAIYTDILLAVLTLGICAFLTLSAEWRQHLRPHAARLILAAGYFFLAAHLLKTGISTGPVPLGSAPVFVIFAANALSVAAALFICAAIYINHRMGPRQDRFGGVQADWLTHVGAAFGQAPLWIGIKNLDGRYMYVNETYANAIGTTPNGIIGRFAPEVHNAAVAELSLRLDQQVKATAQPLSESFEYFDGAGKLESSQLHVKFPIPGENNETAALGSITVDTTQEGKLREQLAESEARFRDFAEIGSDFLWELDADFRFSYSTRIVEFKDLPPQSAIGKTPWDVLGIDIEQSATWRNYRDALKRHEQFENFEFKYALPSGEVRFYTVRGRPIFDRNGTFTGYRCTTSDITGLKRAEQTMRDAIDSLPVSFVLFDAEDSLQLFNNRAKSLFARVGIELRKRSTFEELVREGVSSGAVIIDDCQSADEWIERRLQQHARPELYMERSWSDGTIVGIYERKTSEGGTVAVHVDLSTLRNAQRTAEAREHQLREFLDKSPIGISIADLTADTRVYTNSEFDRMMRGGAPGALAPVADSWVNADERAYMIDATVNQGFAGPKVVERRRLDGTQFWSLMHAQKVMDFEGQPALLSWNLDITEQIEAERAANAANASLNAFIENAPCSFRFKDMNGRYVMANRLFAANRGLSKEELVGKKDTEVLTEAELDLARSYDRHIIETGERVDLEFDGTNHMAGKRFATTVFPIRDAKGEMLGIGGISVDITDRTKTEKELRDLNNLLNAFMDYAPCAITMLDLNGRYLLANKEFLRLNQVSESDVIGKRHADFGAEISDTSRTAVKRMRAKVLSSGQSETEIIEFQHSGHRYSEYTLFPIRNEENEITALGRFGFNVSERVEANRRLALREQELRRIIAAVQLADEGISIQSAGRQMIYANDAALRLRGMDNGGIKRGEDCVEVLKRTDKNAAAIFVDQIEPALKRDGRWTGEVPFNPKGGDERIVEYQATALPDGDIIVVTTDVTDRKMAAKAIVEINEQFRSVVENAGVGIALRDMEGRYLLANEQYRDMFDIQDDLVIGKCVAEFFKPEIANRLSERDKEVFASRTPKTWEVFDTPNSKNATAHYLITKFPIVGHDSTIRGIGSIVQDVTEIRRRDAILSIVMDSLPILLSLSNNKGEIVYANRLLQAALDAKEDDYIGQRLPEFYKKKADDQPIRKLIHQVLQTGEKIENLEIYSPVMKKTVLGSIIPLKDGGGHVSEVIACAIDITDRKAYETQLVQASKLATLGEISASLVHEISQPLNIIRLSAEGTLLRLARGKADQEYQSTQFRRIEQQTARMSEIIENIRIFSRNDTANFEPFDPVPSIQNAIDLIVPQLAPKNITLTTSLELPSLQVEGRPIHLEQVVLNLLSNARDAIEAAGASSEDAPPSGKIHVELSIDPDTDILVIAVSDNGGGIPDDVVDHLFEPFFTTKNAAKGTGLGLSISSSIISNMSGELTAKNIPGGACFEVSLPCKPASALGNGNQAIDLENRYTVDDRAPFSILIVDDEIAAVNSLQEVLSGLGYVVRCASNGEDALREFHKDPVDLLVTDLRMPKLNGRKLIREIRSVSRQLPVIVVTGDLGETETLGSEFDPGITRLIRKPVSLRDLESEIESLRHPDSGQE